MTLHLKQGPRLSNKWGPPQGRVPPDTRDEVIDYVGKWTGRAELPAKQLLGWIGLPTSKYHLWRQHYGRPHAHNAHIPRDGWLEAWEKQAIVHFHRRFPLEGYRRLTVCAHHNQA